MFGGGGQSENIDPPIGGGTAGPPHAGGVAALPGCDGDCGGAALGIAGRACRRGALTDTGPAAFPRDGGGKIAPSAAAKGAAGVGGGGALPNDGAPSDGVPDDGPPSDGAPSDGTPNDRLGGGADGMASGGGDSGGGVTSARGVGANGRAMSGAGIGGIDIAPGAAVPPPGDMRWKSWVNSPGCSAAEGGATGVGAGRRRSMAGATGGMMLFGTGADAAELGTEGGRSCTP